MREVVSSLKQQTSEKIIEVSWSIAEAKQARNILEYSLNYLEYCKTKKQEATGKYIEVLRGAKRGDKKKQ